tara:strand:+ start:170 stop:472 length:303 start_codon:yes stop_codon:yes gene_type:complete
MPKFKKSSGFRMSGFPTHAGVSPMRQNGNDDRDKRYKKDLQKAQLESDIRNAKTEEDKKAAMIVAKGVRGMKLTEEENQFLLDYNKKKKEKKAKAKAGTK